MSFLQELLGKGRTPSTLKVYVAAIATNHALVVVQLVGRNDFIKRGAGRLNLLHPHTVPTWDLSTVLRDFQGSPFELLQAASVRPL